MAERYLESILYPAALRKLKPSELRRDVDELRQETISVVSVTRLVRGWASSS